MAIRRYNTTNPIRAYWLLLTNRKRLLNNFYRNQFFNTLCGDKGHFHASLTSSDPSECFNKTVYYMPTNGSTYYYHNGQWIKGE